MHTLQYVYVGVEWHGYTGCLGLGPHPAVLRIHSQLYTQELLLVVLSGSYQFQEIEHRSAVSKLSASLAILLWPQFLNFQNDSSFFRQEKEIMSFYKYKSTYVRSMVLMYLDCQKKHSQIKMFKILKHELRNILLVLYRDKQILKMLNDSQ